MVRALGREADVWAGMRRFERGQAQIMRVVIFSQQGQLAMHVNVFKPKAVYQSVGIIPDGCCGDAGAGSVAGGGSAACGVGLDGPVCWKRIARA